MHSGSRREQAARKAAAYLRKSMPGLYRQATSLLQQRQSITAFARRNGYKIVKWYREAKSGTDVVHRKMFLRMIEDAITERCGFDCIICYDISRFGRLDNDEAAFYRHTLRLHGVELLYSSEDLCGDDTDDLVVSAKQWLAREFSIKLSEQVQRSVLTLYRRAARDGHPFHRGSRPPYGYDVAYLDNSGKAYMVVRWMENGSRQILRPDGVLVRTIPRARRMGGAGAHRKVYVLSAPERVDTVRRLFSIRVKEHAGTYMIARRLNTAAEEGEGPPSPGGCCWHGSTVGSILRNEIYLGHSICNRSSVAKFYRILGGRTVAVQAHGPERPRLNDWRDWLVVRNTHMPIIDEETFRQAQEALDSQSRPSPAGDQEQ